MTTRDPRFKSYEQKYAEAIGDLTARIEHMLTLPPGERNADAVAREHAEWRQREGWKPRVAAYDEPELRPENVATPEQRAAYLKRIRESLPDPTTEVTN